MPEMSSLHFALLSSAVFLGRRSRNSQWPGPDLFYFARARARERVFKPVRSAKFAGL
jgi:hypothetical protein